MALSLPRFLLLPLTANDRLIELRYGGVDKLGRKTCGSLDNLHISRDQLHFEVLLDASGKLFVRMHNRGKNSTRVVCVSRHRYARVVKNVHCRIVPGDVIEVLYDQHGRYAFRLVECPASGGPLVRNAPLVASVASYVPFSLPRSSWPVLSRKWVYHQMTDEFAIFLSRHPHFEMSVDKVLCAAVVAHKTPTTLEFVRAVSFFMNHSWMPAPARPGVAGGRRTLMETCADGYMTSIAPDEPIQSVGSRFFALERMLCLARCVLALEYTDGPRAAPAAEEDGEDWGTGAMDVQLPVLEGGAPAPAASSLAAFDEYFQDALEEWDEADEEEDARAAARLAAERLAEAEEAFELGLRIGGGGATPAPGAGGAAYFPLSSLKRVSRASRMGEGGAAAIAAVAVTPEAAAVATAAVATPAPQTDLSCLPREAIMAILSYLPTVEAVAATGVCKEWRHELRLPAALAQVDYGAVFPGPIAPSPLLVDSVSRSIKGRSLIFANCVWLTSGALLHVLGVPLGAQPVAVLPYVPKGVRGANAQSNEAERRSIAEEMVVVMQPRSPDSPRTAAEQQCRLSGSHAYLRHFFGELQDSQLEALGLLHIPPCGPEGSGGIHAHSGGMNVDGAGLDSQWPWWFLLGPGMRAALTSLPDRGPEGWLTPGDACLATVGAHVHHHRIALQHEDIQRTTAHGCATSSMLNPAIVSSAYVEMALGLAALRHRIQALRRVRAVGLAVQPPPGSPQPPDALLLSGASVINSPSLVGSVGQFPPLGELRTKVARVTEDLAISRGQGAALPTRPRPEWDSSLYASDEAFETTVFASPTSAHALAVAYTVAAGDVFGFAAHLVKERMPGRGDAPFACTHLLSWDIPAPIHVTSPDRPCCPAHEIARHPEWEGQDRRMCPRITPGNVLGPPLPATYSSSVTGLDLASCTRLTPCNLSLVLSYVPHLTTLRLAGCHQFTAPVLAHALSVLSKLRTLDLEYLGPASVNDSVLASIGRHCPHLSRLVLGGCIGITDRGISAAGLLQTPIASHLRILDLRGCRSLTDASVISLGHLCPGLRELFINGIPTITPGAMAGLLLVLSRLTRFKAELWFERGRDAGDGEADLVQRAEVPPDSAGSKRQYRLMGSTQGAVRYLRTILPQWDAQRVALTAMYLPESRVEATAAEGEGPPSPNATNAVVSAGMPVGGGKRPRTSSPSAPGEGEGDAEEGGMDEG